MDTDTLIGVIILGALCIVLLGAYAIMLTRRIRLQKQILADRESRYGRATGCLLKYDDGRYFTVYGERP